MKLNQIDIIVPNVIESATSFGKLLGVLPDELGERFAQVTVGETVFMFSPDAMVDMRSAEGMILHFEVAEEFDVDATVEVAGAKVLMPTTVTDWGTTSTLVSGPGGIVIDFYRPGT